MVDEKRKKSYADAAAANPGINGEPNQLSVTTSQSPSPILVEESTADSTQQQKKAASHGSSTNGAAKHVGTAG